MALTNQSFLRTAPTLFSILDNSPKGFSLSKQNDTGLELSLGSSKQLLGFA